VGVLDTHLYSYRAGEPHSPFVSEFEPVSSHAVSRIVAAKRRYSHAEHAALNEIEMIIHNAAPTADQ